ncbi:MAG: hypothetical protein M1819_002654 [Sarea resinae]|nr:MAG: hypothetical protein M1819_002654 [Sarea resinae]
MSASSSMMPTATSVGSAINEGSGKGQTSQGVSLGSFLASLAVAFATFGIEFVLFVLIKGKLSRIYAPRTYLVPKKERTKAAPPGLLNWIVPIFQTSNSDFIRKCGLDAYFFLRYLRTLLKIFIPLAMIILPILLPINHIGGRGSHFATGKYQKQDNVTGLDTFAWGNVRPDKTSRYWAHLVLAVFVVVYVCFTFFDELRGYIRLRQAYLTSPQHRLRASATTVLVTSIPRKWLSVEALDGLYDVFPGGLRNIWINRDFDELNDKVKLRNKLARSLEAAETSLIKKAKKAHMKELSKEEKEAKKAGKKPSKRTAEEHQGLDGTTDEGAPGPGVSSGDPHQVRHTLHEALQESSRPSSRNASLERSTTKRGAIPLAAQGLGLVGHGLGTVGHTVVGGVRKVGKGVDNRLQTTGGFVVDDDGEALVADQRAGGPSLDRTGPSGTTGNGLGVDGAGDDRTNYARGRSTDSDTTVVPDGNRRQGIKTATSAGPKPSEDAQEAQRRLSGPYSGPIDPRINNPHRSPPHSVERTVSQDDLGPPEASWMWWKRKRNTMDIPSPRPLAHEDDEYPLSTMSPATPGANGQATVNSIDRKASKKRKIKNPLKKHKVKEGETEEGQHYPAAFNEDYDDEEDDEPLWKKYVKEKDRETSRLPIFGWQWMPALPLMGKKVDTIDYCRRELARLNVEIEQDQQEPEKFALMNSAFVQFNHQVAAHMACQSVSHHVPQQMAPRMVEISPDDVLWENMSIKWWERYLRTGIVIALVALLIIGWAFPVTFTGLLSQVKYLTTLWHWLRWIDDLPSWVISLIQGVLPQALLAALLAVLPAILRLFAKQSGVHTGMAMELAVQDYYFFFLFVQVFLVVSISSGITTVISQLTSNVGSVPQLLANNLPKASNYFFSYLLLQAFSVSAGALVQIGGLFSWFILAPLLDNTARQKWARQTNLPQMQWGTFFPVYTNLAAIGLIYSVISPLMLVFNIVTFGLFWIVYRYNTLYVTKFRFDTGGLLFPKAINQLFTGLYVMELCLIGLFFLVRDAQDRVACKAQAIVMIVVTVATVLYQYLLNSAFSPLFRYLPITLEDEAVRRDEEFARAQAKRLNVVEDEDEGDNIQGVLEERERRSQEEDRQVEELEMKVIETGNVHHRLDPRALGKIVPRKNWADRSSNHRSTDFGHYSPHPSTQNVDRQNDLTAHDQISKHHSDLEAQRTPNPVADALFSGINDEIEDLTPEERDKLVQRAFQHEALRAKRPVIWIPRDELGVSDDEIYRTQRFSKHVWISNAYTGLDRKGRVVYRRSPPDFSEVDLIEL